MLAGMNKFLLTDLCKITILQLQQKKSYVLIVSFVLKSATQADYFMNGFFLQYRL